MSHYVNYDLIRNPCMYETSSDSARALLEQVHQNILAAVLICCRGMGIMNEHNNSRRAQDNGNIMCDLCTPVLECHAASRNSCRRLQHCHVKYVQANAVAIELKSRYYWAMQRSL